MKWKEDFDKLFPYGLRQQREPDEISWEKTIDVKTFISIQFEKLIADIPDTIFVQPKQGIKPKNGNIIDISEFKEQLRAKWLN